MKYDSQTIFMSYRSIILRIYWLPLKANEFNGLNDTSFLKNFVILLYLFIFDSLNS